MPTTPIEIPTAPGTYALHLRLGRPRRLGVGRLGHVLFPAGDYIYVGSAFGPGGLRTRLGRHLRGDGHPHWHIDTLRAAASVVGYVFAIADQPVECRWSQALAALPQARIPAPGFGSSDCRSGCQAHLIAFPVGSDLRHILKSLVPASVVC